MARSTAYLAYVLRGLGDFVARLARRARRAPEPEDAPRLVPAYDPRLPKGIASYRPSRLRRRPRRLSK